MLIVKGDVAAFDLDDGTTVTIPDDFGMIHDPLGNTLDKCVVYLTPYEINRGKRLTIPNRMVELVDEYFGKDTPKVRADVEIPDGPWHRLGVVRQIHYARYGKHDGPWYHPFEDSEIPNVVLHESRCAPAFMLELPEACILNWRGFVYP